MAVTRSRMLANPRPPVGMRYVEAGAVVGDGQSHLRASRQLDGDVWLRCAARRWRRLTGREGALRRQSVTRSLDVHGTAMPSGATTLGILARTTASPLSQAGRARPDKRRQFLARLLRQRLGLSEIGLCRQRIRW